MIENLIKEIEDANIAYRLGFPIMSDKDYDKLLDRLSKIDPNNDLISKIGFKINGNRKSKLPHLMASMNKIKSINDIEDWCRLKNISNDTEVILTPKYDGLSLLVDEINVKAWTRGDGEYGQSSDDHYKLMLNKLQNTDNIKYTYGEVMMDKKTFINKYSNDFANPRNLVAGILNSDTISEFLKDLRYIKYGAIFDDNVFKLKSDLISYLNNNQEFKVEFEVFKIKDLTEDLLINLFKKWSNDYEIDGIIIEINDINLQNKLGRETTTNNPVYARAFKHSSFEQTSETIVNGLSWNISKQGFLKPIIHVNPVKLDGVTVSNVTGNNARFIKEMGIGVGSKVVIKRSGMVIPLIVDVLERVDFKIPNIENIKWNDSGVELITIDETDEQRFKKIVSFFEILESDNVSEGILRQLWNSNFKTIKDILNLKKDDLLCIDGFGDRKSEIVYNSIQNSIKNVSLNKLMHASGIFGNGLGSKKLKLLEHFTTKPNIDDIISIDGFAETTAKNFIENYDNFYNFIKDLPIEIKKLDNNNNLNNNFIDYNFVFTGIRMKNEEKILEDIGIKVSTSVSKNTSHVVCKNKNDNSSKLKKARELNLTIMDVDEFLLFLKSII